MEQWKKKTSGERTSTESPNPMHQTMEPPSNPMHQTSRKVVAEDEERPGLSRDLSSRTQMAGMMGKSVHDLSNEVDLSPHLDEDKCTTTSCLSKLFNGVPMSAVVIGCVLVWLLGGAAIYQQLNDWCDVLSRSQPSAASCARGGVPTTLIDQLLRVSPEAHPPSL